MNSPVAGVLALQGAFARHQTAVEALGRRTRLVRSPEDLEGIMCLIIPGGESTVIGKLLKINGLQKAIIDAVASGLPVFGTCAGLILLAKEVAGQKVAYLRLLDLQVERNGWGRQKESFKTEMIWEGKVLEGIFIRAPRIVQTAPEVEILCSLNEEAVLVRQGKILAATFHPELTDDLSVHKYFLNRIC